MRNTSVHVCCDSKLLLQYHHNWVETSSLLTRNTPCLSSLFLGPLETMTSIQSLSSHGPGDRRKLTFLYEECNRCNYWWSLFFLISLPCSECYRSCLGFLLGQVQATHLRAQHDTHLSSVSVEINITFSSLLESLIIEIAPSHTERFW